MNKGYWSNETPQEVDTGKNILRYFAKSDKLQISMPNWINADGQETRGKTLTLDLAAVREKPDAMEIIRRIVDGQINEAAI